MAISKFHIDRNILHRESFLGNESIYNNPFHKGTPTSITFGSERGLSYGDFDGTSSKIALIGTVYGIKSVSFWIYLDNTSKDIIDFDGGTHSIEVSSGTLSATGFDTPTIYVDNVATTTITGSAWHQVIITTATAFNGTAIEIGTETSFLDGKLADLNIWNTELSASEVTNLYNNSVYKTLQTSGLFLNTDALSGIIKDRRDVTLTLTSTSVVNYGGNYVMDFNGSTTTIPTGITSNTDFQNGFTISAWINSKSVVVSGGGGRRIIDKSETTSGGNGFYFIVTSDNKLACTINNGVAVTSALNVLVLKRFQHVLVTVSSDGIANFYVDGVLSGDANQDITNTCAEITTANALTVGNRSGDTDRAFDGKILGIKIWNKVLTQNQITQEYTSIKFLVK